MSKTSTKRPRKPAVAFPRPRVTTKKPKDIVKEALHNLPKHNGAVTIKAKAEEAIAKATGEFTSASFAEKTGLEPHQIRGYLGLAVKAKQLERVKKDTYRKL